MIRKGAFYILGSESEAIRLLTEKAAELGRLPHKGDFPENSRERLRRSWARGRERWKKRD